MKKLGKKGNVLWIHYVYDLQNGGRAVLSRFLPAVVLFIVGCVLYQLNIMETLRSYGLTDRSGFLDTWFFLFQGNVGLVPITWLTIQLYIPFVVLLYPVQDLGGSGTQLLVRSRQRESWWTSKLLWAYTVVFLYYLLLVVVVAVFTAAVGGQSVNQNALYLMKAPEDLSIGLFWAMLLGPVLSSLAFVSLELVVSATASPVIGFLTVLFLQVLTIFYYSPFLFGNVSMLDRISVLGYHSASFYEMADVAVAVCMISWLVGRRVIAKKDILGNNEDRYES